MLLYLILISITCFSTTSYGIVNKHPLKSKNISTFTSVCQNKLNNKYNEKYIDQNNDKNNDKFNNKSNTQYKNSKNGYEYKNNKNNNNKKKYGDEYVYQPQQIHISYSSNPYEMVITWNTKCNTNTSEVQYSLSGGKPMFNYSVKGGMESITKFVDGGSLKNTQYIHRITLPNLIPGKTYLYRCGSQYIGWSDIFYFRAMRRYDLSSSSEYPHLIYYGDLGDTNSVSLARIQQEAQKGLYDAILHIGDFAYNFYSQNGTVGDKFMNDIQSAAAYVPYMTAVGNHEYLYNFSHYLNRFTMPGYYQGQGNMYYSWNIGPLHIITLSSEYYYFFPGQREQLVQQQYQWLENDLIRANLPQNRFKQPWIIVMGHKPFYCSNVAKDLCATIDNPIRVGLLVNNTRIYGLEYLLTKYSVDLTLWAHEHSYERLYPVYDYNVYKEGVYYKNKIAYYYNPKVPVQIISGSPGCNEKLTPFKNKTFDWSAFRSETYGYGHMYAHNATHLNLVQINGTSGKTIDNLWIIKDR